MWGPLQLSMELGSLGCLSLLLLFQLPLPLMELMESEVLDILKKALISEHPTPTPTPASTKDPGGFGRAWGCGVSGYVVLSDPLSTHKDALKIKSQESRHRPTQWSE